MISLRGYTLEDLERLVALASNKNVSRYLVDTFPYPYTEEDGRYWIDSGSRENGSITKVIELSGLFVGSVGLTPKIGWESHVAEIGYWVAEDFWGKGIATSALEMMTKLAFTELEFRKLMAPVLEPNIASMRVLEKCGYESEGCFRNHVFKDGEYFDVFQYARHDS